MFDSDFGDDPRLPSPNQLRHRILIKNKKLKSVPVMPAIQVRIRDSNQQLARRQPHRTNSLLSVTSSGSLNEDEDDFEDDDDDDDDDILPHSGSASSLRGQAVINAKAAALRTESSSSQEGAPITNVSNLAIAKTVPISVIDVEPSPPLSSSAPAVSHSKIVRKSSSQVAPELSDLVNYCQAVKFRGLIPIEVNVPPASSAPSNMPAVKKISSKKNILSNMVPTSMSSSSTSQSQQLSTQSVTQSALLAGDLQVPNSSHSNVSTPTTNSLPQFPGSAPSASSATISAMTSTNSDQQQQSQLTNLPSKPASISGSSTLTPPSQSRRANATAPCYQVVSINEPATKKLCRKSPLAVLNYTESQLMRSYPAGMRIDSSNFNPVNFWAFGIQMAALNYQTEDIGAAVNGAMFEQNGAQGYVRKPPVMVDRGHVMYGRFNPWEKEFDGLYAVDVTISVSSSPPLYL